MSDTRHPDHAIHVLPIGERAVVEQATAWAAHVAAGRIGTPVVMSADELERLRRNELAVLGHTPSFLPVPRPRGR